MEVSGVGNKAVYQGIQNTNSSNSTYQKTDRVLETEKLTLSKISNVNSEEKEQKIEGGTEISRLEKAIKDANNKLTKTKCEYTYNDEINRVSIRVIDKETDKVIKEIPPEETLKALEKIWEIAGLLIDERR